MLDRFYKNMRSNCQCTSPQIDITITHIIVVGTNDLKNMSFDQMASYVRSRQALPSFFIGPQLYPSLRYNTTPPAIMPSTRESSSRDYFDNSDLSYEMLLELDKTIKKEGVSDLAKKKYVKLAKPSVIHREKDCHVSLIFFIIKIFRQICMDQFLEERIALLPCKHMFQ